MLTRALAESLHDAGLPWTPEQGDAFMVPDRDLEEMVFVLSDMVVELVDNPRFGQALAFNGTTEWALDSLEATEALWLPREDQLRERIGDRLVSLERVPGPPVGWAVTVTRDDTDGVGGGSRGSGIGGGSLGSGGSGGSGGERYVDVTAEAAYARALLALLDSP